MSITNDAARLANQWSNGNRNGVKEELAGMDALRAASVALYIFDHLDDFEAAQFRRGVWRAALVAGEV